VLEEPAICVANRELLPPAKLPCALQGHSSGMAESMGQEGEVARVCVVAYVGQSRGHILHLPNVQAWRIW
jgi:hypothetical protein